MNTTWATQKINVNWRNQQWKQRKDNEKKSKIDGDDGGVAFAGENNGGAYRGVRERICTEKRKKKPNTVVKQQKQVRWRRRTRSAWWRRRNRSVVVEEEKLYGWEVVTVEEENELFSQNWKKCENFPEVWKYIFWKS